MILGRGISGTLSAFAIAIALSGYGGARAESFEDNAARFGALEAVRDVSLSPDGNKLAFIQTGQNGSRRLLVVDVRTEAVPLTILRSERGEDGNLNWCGWVTNARLACQTVARGKMANGEILSFSAVLAVDADGGNVRGLSTTQNWRSDYFDLRGAEVIDWLPADNGSLLMARAHVPESEIGSNISSRAAGLGVDRIDVVSGKARRVEFPDKHARGFLSDGHGQVRVMARQYLTGAQRSALPTIRYYYRAQDGRGGWKHLSDVDVVTRAGFEPVAVDAASNRAFGFQKIDGRLAVVAMALDGTGTVNTIHTHPEVDVDEIIRVGRNGRIAGVSFATDRRQAMMTEPGMVRIIDELSTTLGDKQILIVDASADESRYLIWASSDTDPGQYYLYNSGERALRPLLGSRDALANLRLSTVQPIRYPAADGTMIPGYLTLPPGRTDARGLPAIVMPHGGPAARDEWGFDWLSQYFAQSGYAVLQPNFRGSSGYGDIWYQNNGFQSWKTAIGDVADGGRWLLTTHGVDAKKLSIVGWSYGGYAALQSGVVAPDLFKAIVAIAPVTDLAQLKDEEAKWGARVINDKFIGSGPHIREGSPAQNAEAIKAPVLMFHGSFDENVDIAQARTMRRALEGKGKRVELVEYPELAHSLETSEARTDMLRRISAFLPH